MIAVVHRETGHRCVQPELERPVLTRPRLAARRRHVRLAQAQTRGPVHGVAQGLIGKGETGQGGGRSRSRTSWRGRAVSRRRRRHGKTRRCKKQNINGVRQQWLRALTRGRWPKKNSSWLRKRRRYRPASRRVALLEHAIVNAQRLARCLLPAKVCGALRPHAAP